MIGHNLTAAASRILTPKSQIRKVGENWQERLWEIYEHLGPVHYGVGFKRNSAQKVTYFPAEQMEASEEPVLTENSKALEAFERLGSLEELVGELVVHQNVAGEGYLVGQERDNEENWEVWSTIEVNAARSGQKRKQDDVEPLTDDDFVLRIWRAAPYWRSKPDSPLRSVQQQCEQLLLLNEQIGAVAMSRLSAGILLVPSELSFTANAEDPPDTGANADGDPFMAEIIDIATLPITDSESAARVAPAVIRGNSEYLKEISHMTFGREIDSTFADMREELLRQIAAGLDLPPEIVLGKADLNHWSAWDVDDSAAKLHVDPDVLQVIDGITTGYFRPALEEDGMSSEKARGFLIWRDYSDLTSRPVSIDQAQSLFDKSIIEAKDVRRIANLPDPEDTPDDSSDVGDLVARSEAVGVLFRAGFEAEAVLEALELPQIEHTGVAPVTVQSEEEVEENADPPAGPENVERSPPEPIIAAAGTYLGELGEIDRNLATKIIEASQAAFGRALERAGAKIRAKARKDRQITAAIDGIDNRDVPRHLGMRRVEQLQLTDELLVPADTFDPLKARLDTLIANAQGQRRRTLADIIDRPVAEIPEEAEDRDLAIAWFIAALIAITSQRLFTDGPEPDPAETGELVDGITTGQMVYQLLTQAGGGGEVDPFTIESSRGLGLGERTRAILKDHGYLTTTETWVYGDPASRLTNFEPHRALGGETYVPTRPPISALWLGVEFMFPGDHVGCLCQLVPTVELDVTALTKALIE